MAEPQLGSCTSSGPAWRLRAARHSREEASPLGTQPLPRVLERAASKVADFTVLDHAGGDAISARLSAAELTARAAERDYVGELVANSTEADEMADGMGSPSALAPARQAYAGPVWPLPADLTLTLTLTLTLILILTLTLTPTPTPTLTRCGRCLQT